MTPIADKIRAIVGINGKLTLDDMSVNLETIQSNISDAFTTVGNRGGTIPSSKISSNLASAINSIPSGVTVQKVSGSFSTDGNSEAYVICDFVPDVVMLSTTSTFNYAAIWTSDMGAKQVTCRSEIDIGGVFEAWVTIFDYDIYKGFFMLAQTLYWAWETGPFANKTLYYIALKYT